MDWKEIERLDGKYSVSSTGLIRNNISNKILKQNIIGRGYPAVCVKPNGRFSKGVCIRTHREVAICFVNNPDNKAQVNHIDGDKTNNHHLNLEWVTHSENTQHAYKTGLNVAPKGEQCTQSVLTEELILQIRREFIPFDREFGLRALGRKYGFKHNTMSEALHGVNWKLDNSTI